MNNYSFLPLQKQIIHVENFIPRKRSCTNVLIFIILPDKMLYFAFWVTYQCISLIEEVSYILCYSYKHFSLNPTFGSKTSTTNGGMSAYQTHPCSRQWSKSCSCPCSPLTMQPLMQFIPEIYQSFTILWQHGGNMSQWQTSPCAMVNFCQNLSVRKLILSPQWGWICVAHCH